MEVVQAIVTAEKQDNIVSKLHSILKPFLLRRMKSDVELALPRKAEIVLYAQMTPHQKDLNKRLLDSSAHLQVCDTTYVPFLCAFAKFNYRHASTWGAFQWLQAMYRHLQDHETKYAKGVCVSEITTLSILLVRVQN